MSFVANRRRSNSGGRLRLGCLQRQLTVGRVHAHGVPGMDLAGEQGEREPVDELLLDHPPQRTGAVGRVIAHVCDQLARLIGERYLHTALGDPLDHAGDLEVDDLRDLLTGEGAEADDIVEAVDELGLEVLEQFATQTRVCRCARACAGLRRVASERQVRGHDQDGVLEVDRAPLAVG